MRFDDSLSTVLAADSSTAFGAQSTFRQITDLLARRRVQVSPALLARLEALRPQVPLAVRAACARSLALADPPEALIAFFAGDDPAVATAALRAVTLNVDSWGRLLPQIGPTGRAALRARGDLPPATMRALEAFGAVDFTIGFVSDSAAAREHEPGPTAPTSQAAVPSPPPPHGFPIAELVDRIAAFQRSDLVVADAPPPVTRFAFETDRDGYIRWTDAEPRGALLGVRLKGELGGAVRQRRAVSGGELTLSAGESLTGAWRIDGQPAFDREGGYLGLRGMAVRVEAAPEKNGEAIRRLVHELRTPMNAISGFAELMGSEMLGPVPPVHRDAAGAIHTEMAALLAAIEDLDVAARIDERALDLQPQETAVWPLLERHRDRVEVTGDRDAMVHADPRALGRLIDRLVDLLGRGERIRLASDGCWTTLTSTHVQCDAAVSSLLGTSFTLRLVGDLARELGGTFEPGERLTLRLPARLDQEVRIGGAM